MEKSKSSNRGRELAKNTVIITVGKICTQFISFLLLPIYTAYLSTSDYGTVDLLNTYQQLILYVVALQIEQAVFRFLIDIRDNESGKKEIISTAFVFALMQSFLMVSLGILISLFFAIPYLLYLVLNIILCIWSGLLLQCARGFGNNSVYATGSFVTALFTILANIFFVVTMNYGARGMLLGSAIGSSCGILFLIVRENIFEYVSIKLFRISILKELLRYSMPLVPNALSWWIVAASDRTIVSSFLGTGANGIISVSNKFSSIIATVNSIFNLSWTESATLHFNDTDRDDFLSRTIQTTLKLFLSFSLLLIAFMGIAFNWLVNDSYGLAYYQIPLYIISAFLNSLQGLYSVIYVALKKTKEIAKSTMVAAIINIIVDLILIRYIGLYAASISSITAYLVICIYRYFDIKKYVNLRLGHSIIFNGIAYMMVVCLCYYSQKFVLKVICFILLIPLTLYINRNVAGTIVTSLITKIRTHT